MARLATILFGLTMTALVAGCFAWWPAHHGGDDDAADDDDNDNDDSDGLTWIALDGGTFQMGCSPNDADCRDDETPHTTTVGGFAITNTPITQAQYAARTGDNPSYFTGCASCPVEQTTWNAAAAFCAGVGGRLPTEAEWEFAARAGTTTRTYCGEEATCLAAIAWYRDNSNLRTQPVGERRPNHFDLYDMLGNVWEWVNDWYDPAYYQTGPSVDPPGPQSGADRVRRGGAWNNDASYLRASARNYDQPNDSDRATGFRCVRSRLD